MNETLINTYFFNNNINMLDDLREFLSEFAKKKKKAGNCFQNLSALIMR